MFSRIRAHLSYANVMSTIAVFVVIGGGAYAASQLPKNSVGSAQIKSGAVKSPEAKNLKCKDFKGSEGACSFRKVAVRTKTATLPQGNCQTFGTSPQTSCSIPPTQVTARCKAGERASGGGYDLFSEGSPGATPYRASFADEERPDPTQGEPTGWTVSATGFTRVNGSNPGAPPPITVYAVCGN